jgi:hypothetical protein
LNEDFTKIEEKKFGDVKIVITFAAAFRANKKSSDTIWLLNRARGL